MTTVEERAAVYRFYASDDTLLYVGVTQRFGTRWSNHAKQKPWWPQVARQTVVWYDTRTEALRVETDSIKMEKPMHNVIHAPKPPKPRKPQNTEKHTPMRPIRIPDDEWEALGKAVGDRNRTRLLREYIRWHLRWPGNAQPTREAKQVGGPGISSKSGDQKDEE